MNHFMMLGHALTGEDARHLMLRRGAASVEVVMATAVSFVMLGLLFPVGVRACRNLFHVVTTLVGWPYL